MHITHEGYKANDRDITIHLTQFSETDADFAIEVLNILEDFLGGSIDDAESIDRLRAAMDRNYDAQPEQFRELYTPHEQAEISRAANSIRNAHRDVEEHILEHGTVPIDDPELIQDYNLAAIAAQQDAE